MTSSQFSFLKADFEDNFEAAIRAERYALDDPGTAVIHARRSLEIGVRWVFAHDRSLPQPYEQTLNAHIHEPAFQSIANGMVFTLARKIQKAGNRAVHEAKPPSKLEAVEIVSALFNFCKWLAFVYAQPGNKPDPNLTFNPHNLPRVEQAERSSLKARQELEEQIEAEAEATEIARQRLVEASRTIEELEAERAALIAKVAEAKRAAEQLVPVEALDWSEAETRKFQLDLLLAEAGWKFDQLRDTEYEVAGMPSASGVGYVDYVLWGDDGLPLAIVEAKKTRVSATTGQQQAKLYADCLEAQTGQRPIIFYSNGYQTWMWDDTTYPPRQVQGFYTKDELVLAIGRRTARHPLGDLDSNDDIAGRFYQQRAIRSIADHFEDDRQRKALLVMATGSGKTRTTIALVDLLMRANWVKRVLFLADRTALVNQAVGAFKAHLPDSAPVNLVTEPNQDGRVYVSTYQTMVGKIDEYAADGTRRFGVGHFDLVIIDEAHRSVYKKYKSIFDYFDSLLVGLTATPKDEVSKNTYDLFDLETGVPTDAYSLDDAINDGHLVPPWGVSVPLKFVREGIAYDDLSEDEKDDWDELDWGEDEDGNVAEPPDRVEAGQLNKFLFNQDTVDKVLEVLMRDGIKVAGGDRLGKTIVFAKNQAHADFIYQRFCVNYPALDGGNFARVVTHSTKYAQSLIDDFSNPGKAPHIAISVDMLDTGIDVPECVNLVFFKLVRSRTKFWQMLGRGTRLSPDLFGPGEDKAGFNVFDFCQNLEYFSQPLVPGEGGDITPLKEQIFKARLELIQTLDQITGLDDERAEIAATLRETLASMNDHNFIVRPHLELVERFRSPEAWNELSMTDLAALAENVAGLPDQLGPDHVDSRRFDVLILNAQLRQLQNSPFERERGRIKEIASLLEEISSGIPHIAAQLDLLQDLQNDDWWVGATYPMLEDVRRRLRELVPLIERRKRGVLYSNFIDTVGEGEVVALPGTGSGEGSLEFVQFRKKAQHFLKEHLGEEVVARVRSGAPITPEDEADLQRILVAAGVGDDATFEEASERAGNFGLFIRSLVGLDRAACKAAFNDFLDDKRYSRRQIEFVNLIIDELTDRGAVTPARLYDAPYIGLSPEGPDDLFAPPDLQRLVDTIKHFTPVSAN